MDKETQRLLEKRKAELNAEDSKIENYRNLEKELSSHIGLDSLRSKKGWATAYLEKSLEEFYTKNNVTHNIFQAWDAHIRVNLKTCFIVFNLGLGKNKVWEVYVYRKLPRILNWLTYSSPLAFSIDTGGFQSSTKSLERILGEISELTESRLDIAFNETVKKKLKENWS